MPGTLAINGPEFTTYENAKEEMATLSQHLEAFELEEIPLIVVGDDSEFFAKELNNYLWATYTRANPSHDIYGVKSFTEFKHWGCKGPLIIDARIKPHHAPPLVTDPDVSKNVDKIVSQHPELKQVLQ